MGIKKRTEYIRYCDNPDCTNSEAADWQTRTEAETAAVRDGWQKRGRHWLCPTCLAAWAVAEFQAEIATSFAQHERKRTAERIKEAHKVFKK